jgi:hypothetical protein
MSSSTGSRKVRLDEVALPSSTRWGRTAQKMIVTFLWCMASRALVVVARLYGMELVPSREVVEAELCTEVASMLHFWVDPAKHIPVHCMECALVLFVLVVVVINEGG